MFRTFVVGINLIIGPDQNDIIYLERENEPALSDQFALSINARVTRNEALFNAALGPGTCLFSLHTCLKDTDLLFL